MIVAAERHAAEIRVRAERKCGELLKEAGIKPGNPQLSNAATIAPKLDELGITRDQSSQWQKLVAVPDVEFPSA